MNLSSDKGLDPDSETNHNNTSLKGEEIVISGISGTFPNSENVKEFMENLYNKVDMITPFEICSDIADMPRHQGKACGFDKFDAQFFKVTYKQATTLDPMTRKIMEHAYSAIYDAGVNPIDYIGKKIGVFVGSEHSDNIQVSLYVEDHLNSFFITGSSKPMLANRVSYWFDGNAPSYAVDVAWVGSMACLEHAINYIKSGLCEAAIVGGSNHCIFPEPFANLKRAGFLCLDGKTKCFNKDGDGYVRSDTVNVIFLQKAKAAKRIYAEVCDTKVRYNLKQGEEISINRNPSELKTFFQNFYHNSDVSPEEVEYVEANASGFAEADKNEMQAIGDFFGKKSTVKIGCVKSNMGHSEPASGICAVTKVCLAYHTGKLPGNLHYTEDASYIGKTNVEIVQDNKPFKRGVTAINNFSFTGVDGHAVLKGHYKPKDNKRYLSNIPYLVTISGRHEDSLNRVINNLVSQTLDAELIALLHNIYQTNTRTHTSRGYVILDQNEIGETVSLARSVSQYAGTTDPVCFIYSGMGSQWAGMGKDLMRIPTFNKAIMKCQKFLQPKGIDIEKIISDPDVNTFNSILNSFVGIIAIQIGLTDILKELGIVPDLIIGNALSQSANSYFQYIATFGGQFRFEEYRSYYAKSKGEGHSLGETGCAYADGCLTVEETIMSTYCRGAASLEGKFIKGAMAAVGLGYNKLKNLVPPEIDIACHNSPESSTISGPAEDIAKFMQELKSLGIFVKEVSTGNLSYHSRYISGAAPLMRNSLNEVIKCPKKRSEKWICTSMPEDKLNDPVTEYCSAEYLVNNLLNPVYFEEACKSIPPNAIIIEIAPHCLLRPILKRYNSNFQIIPLTKTGTTDSVKYLLQGIGKLYEAGLSPKIAELYPKVEFPVSTETPLLSHFVTWDHNETWPLYFRKEIENNINTTLYRDFIMSIHDDDYSFLKGHVRNEVNIFPESALLVLAWNNLAKSLGVNYKSLSVIFRDVKFNGEIIIGPDDLKLAIISSVIKTGGYGNRFEILYQDKLIVSGYIYLHDSLENNVANNNYILRDNFTMNYQDVYNILHQRGYSYDVEFQSIYSTSDNYNKGVIKWTNNWVTFIDGLIQLNVLASGMNGMLRPKLIRELKIDVSRHQRNEPQKSERKNNLHAEVDNVIRVSRCGGLEINDIVFQNIPLPQHNPDVLNNKIFYPYFPTSDCDLETALIIFLQIINEQLTKNSIKIMELDSSFGVSILNYVKNIAKNILINIEIDCSETNAENVYSNNIDSTTDVFVIYDLLQDKQKIVTLHSRLRSNSFVIVLQSVDHRSDVLINTYFYTISSVRINQKYELYLLRKYHDILINNEVSCIYIDNYYQFSWLKEVKSDLSSKKRVILISQNQKCSGVTGMVKNLSTEYGNRIGLLVINDVNAPLFDQDNIFYKEQLQKQLVVNVLENGQWGGYYNTPNKNCTEMKQCFLNLQIPADLNSFKWDEIPSINKSRRTVQVHYAGLSLKDVDKTKDINVSDDGKFGMDFSGIDINGNKVMGIIAGGAIANQIEAHPDLLWPIPEHWTLQEAATVPLAFAHAYYCLAMRATMYKGVSVIVAGGAGALGQAVIALCLKYGHNVYTTVSNIQKKMLLLKLFPTLEEKNIYSSNDEHFAEFVYDNSKTKRLNVVINCSSGIIRQEMMSCVGAKGYFLDISKNDAHENETLGMDFLDWDKNYIAVDFSNIFKSENLAQRKLLQIMVSDGIARGDVRPITYVEYAPQEISRAFHFISSRKHSGKVLINLQKSISEGLLESNPRLMCCPDNSFIVICDKNELGLEVIDLLVKRGARKIILHIKLEVSGYIKSKLACWNESDVDIKLVFDDIDTEEGCSNIFNVAIVMGPIEGLFITLNKQEKAKKLSIEEFAESFDVLSSRIIHLDAISRHFMGVMRYFAIITQSSKNLFEGHINSVSEEICRARNAMGLPGLLFRAELIDQHSPLSNNQKIRPQNIATFLRGLEISLRLNLNCVETYNVKQELILSESKQEKNSALSDSKVSCDLTAEVSLEEVLNGHAEILSKCESVSNKNDMRQKTNFDGGLEAFFPFIDNDIYNTIDPFITMSTRIFNEYAGRHEVDSTATHLMLIPGFNGHYRILEFLCQRLKIKAFTMQLNPDMRNNSIQELAEDILQILKERVVLKKKFYLLGYSFGVNIALELTSMLEKEGHIGFVFCLDSSPDVLRIQMDSYLGQLSDLELQECILQHMIKLVTKNRMTKLTDDIKSTYEWSKKIDLFICQVKGLVSYPHQYLRCLLDSAYKRITLAQNYNPTFELNSQLILIKGIPHPNSKCLPNDYNLSKYCKNPVKIVNIESDTACAPYDYQITNIINKMLDPEIIQQIQEF